MLPLGDVLRSEEHLTFPLTNEIISLISSRRQSKLFLPRSDLACRGLSERWFHFSPSRCRREVEVIKDSKKKTVSCQTSSRGSNAKPFFNHSLDSHLDLFEKLIRSSPALVERKNGISSCSLELLNVGEKSYRKFHPNVCYEASNE